MMKSRMGMVFIFILGIVVGSGATYFVLRPEVQESAGKVTEKVGKTFRDMGSKVEKAGKKMKKEPEPAKEAPSQ